MVTGIMSWHKNFELAPKTGFALYEGAVDLITGRSNDQADLMTVDLMAK